MCVCGDSHDIGRIVKMVSRQMGLKSPIEITGS